MRPRILSYTLAAYLNTIEQYSSAILPVEQQSIATQDRLASTHHIAK